MHTSNKEYYMRYIIRKLKRSYASEAKTRLHYLTPWQLLVATELSAQAMDSTVNNATGKLFKVYKKPGDFAKLTPRQLYKFTKTIGLYRNKSRNIIGAAKLIVKYYDSKVPKSMQELVKLPGVGRKTANVVLSAAYGINEGIAIDTHCITVLNRLGIVHTRDPAKIEITLMKITPRSEWSNITNLLIALGRDVCTARAKHCASCTLNSVCPSSTVKKVIR